MGTEVPVPETQVAGADGIPGLTSALGRGNSAMFLTDVIVELGYATRERVDAVIQEARIAGRSADVPLRVAHACREPCNANCSIDALT